MNSKSDLNILKKALRTELISAFTKLEEDPNVKVRMFLIK
jgi:enoyl-CoA hydratase/carnithine racemase